MGRLVILTEDGDERRRAVPGNAGYLEKLIAVRLVEPDVGMTAELARSTRRMKLRLPILLPLRRGSLAPAQVRPRADGRPVAKRQLVRHEPQPEPGLRDRDRRLNRGRSVEIEQPDRFDRSDERVVAERLQGRTRYHGREALEHGLEGMTYPQPVLSGQRIDNSGREIGFGPERDDVLAGHHLRPGLAAPRRDPVVGRGHGCGPFGGRRSERILSAATHDYTCDDQRRCERRDEPAYHHLPPARPDRVSGRTIAGES